MLVLENKRKVKRETRRKYMTGGRAGVEIGSKARERVVGEGKADYLSL